MTLWQSVKNIAMKAKCGLGFHAGDFAKVDGRPECYREKTCPDCAELLKKEVHAYPAAWENAAYDYGSNLKCAKKQACIHCAKVETRQVHEGFTRVGVNARCRTVEACVRCGEEKLGDEEHSFQLQGRQGDDFLLQCGNCGVQQRKRHMPY